MLLRTNHFDAFFKKAQGTIISLPQFKSAVFCFGGPWVYANTVALRHRSGL